MIRITSSFPTQALVQVAMLVIGASEVQTWSVVSCGFGMRARNPAEDIDKFSAFGTRFSVRSIRQIFPSDRQAIRQLFR